MLFDNSDPSTFYNQPYYSNPEQNPAWRGIEQAHKRGKTYEDIGYGAMLAGGYTLEAFGVPGGSAAVQGAGIYKKNTDAKSAEELNKYAQKFYDMDYNSSGGRPVNAPAVTNPDPTTSLGALGINLKGMYPHITDKNPVSNTNPLGQNSISSTGAEPGLDMQYVSSPVGNVGTENASSGLGGGATGLEDIGGALGGGGTVGFKDGGLMDMRWLDQPYKASIVPGSKEGDHIALVDTATGEDTGKRVAKGEMLVVSKDNVDAIRKHIESGDKDALFKVMQDQVKQTGKDKMAQGGTTDTSVPKSIADLTDAQLAALASSARMTAEEKTAVEREIKKRGFETTGTGFLEAGDPNRTGIGDVTLYKKGGDYEKTKVRPDPKFDYEEWKKISEAPDGEENFPQVGKETAPNTDANKPQTEPTTSGTGGGANGPDLEEKALQGIKGRSNADQGATDPEDLAAANKAVSDSAPVGGGPTGNLAINPISTTTPASGTSFPWQSIATGAAGTAFDAARGIIGYNAAKKPLPSFNKSPDWVDFMHRLKQYSDMGLSASEMANLERQAGQGLAYDTANVRDLSGGNSGMALGNLGRAAGNFYDLQTRIGAMDAQQHRANLGTYGSFLANDVNLDRSIFNDKYQEALWNKEAGSQLTNDAIKNIKERGITNEFYGYGSPNYQLEQEELKGIKHTNDLLTTQQNYYANHPYTPSITTQ